VKDLKQKTEAERLPDRAKRGFTFRVPLVQTTRYLSHLENILKSKGVQFVRRKVRFCYFTKTLLAAKLLPAVDNIYK